MFPFGILWQIPVGWTHIGIGPNCDGSFYIGLRAPLATRDAVPDGHNVEVKLIEQSLLLDIWQNVNERAGALEREFVSGRTDLRRAIDARIYEPDAIAAFPRGREFLVGVLVIQYSQANLLHVVDALRAPRG